MNKSNKDSRNECGWECCPSGFVEHVKHYRYLRDVTDITFREYWWHEFKSLIGLNRVRKTPVKGCKDCKQGECYEHDYFKDFWENEDETNHSIGG